MAALAKKNQTWCWLSQSEKANVFYEQLPSPLGVLHLFASQNALKAIFFKNPLEELFKDSFESKLDVSKSSRFTKSSKLTKSSGSRVSNASKEIRLSHQSHHNHDSHQNHQNRHNHQNHQIGGDGGPFFPVKFQDGSQNEILKATKAQIGEYFSGQRFGL